LDSQSVDRLDDRLIRSQDEESAHAMGGVRSRRSVKSDYCQQLRLYCCCNKSDAITRMEKIVITAILYLLIVLAISLIAEVVIRALLELEDAPWR
jgi:hypothetical protein